MLSQGNKLKKPTFKAKSGHKELKSDQQKQQ